MHIKRGFTLVEVLVVIAIIGMLSTIVIASVGSARQKGRDAKRVADIKELQLALGLYYDANSTYPPAITAQYLVQTGYISVVPTDPTTGNSYKYAAVQNSTGGCTSYHLASTLENSGNSALSGSSQAAAGTACSGSAADFTAVNTASCPGDTAGGYCYDVKP